MPDPESPAQDTKDSTDRDSPDHDSTDHDSTETVSTDRPGTEGDDLPAVDEGTPQERRLDALAPVDTEQLETSQRAIDEAKQAAEPIRRQQRDDNDDERTDRGSGDD